MEHEYADAMKMLARQYYDHEISKDIYRAKRKILVDHMDNEFNGKNIYDAGGNETTTVANTNPIE